MLTYKYVINNFIYYNELYSYCLNIYILKKYKKINLINLGVPLFFCL